MNSLCFKSTSHTTPDKPANAKNTCLSHKVLPMGKDIVNDPSSSKNFHSIMYKDLPHQTNPLMQKHAYSSTNKDCERILHNLCTLDKGSLSQKEIIYVSSSIVQRTDHAEDSLLHTCATNNNQHFCRNKLKIFEETGYGNPNLSQNLPTLHDTNKLNNTKALPASFFLSLSVCLPIQRCVWRCPDTLWVFLLHILGL